MNSPGHSQPLREQALASINNKASILGGAVYAVYPGAMTEVVLKRLWPSDHQRLPRQPLRPPNVTDRRIRGSTRAPTGPELTEPSWTITRIIPTGRHLPAGLVRALRKLSQLPYYRSYNGQPCITHYCELQVRKHVG